MTVKPHQPRSVMLHRCRTVVLLLSCLVNMSSSLANEHPSTITSAASETRANTKGADPEPETPAQRRELALAREQCQLDCSDTPCEAIRFHGFSPDSTRIGYRLLRCPGNLSKLLPKLTWQIRSIVPGRGKLSLKAESMGGHAFPAYFEQHKYHLQELTPEPAGENSWEFKIPGQNVTIRLELATEKTMAWYMHLETPEKRLYSWRGQFEEIYFGFYPSLFLSKDGTRFAVVLLLDAIVKVDAGLAVFSLKP